MIFYKGPYFIAENDNPKQIRKAFRKAVRNERLEVHVEREAIPKAEQVLSEMQAEQRSHQNNHYDLLSLTLSLVTGLSLGVNTYAETGSTGKAVLYGLTTAAIAFLLTQTPNILEDIAPSEHKSLYDIVIREI
jgi:hypothetical protein